MLVKKPILTLMAVLLLGFQVIANQGQAAASPSPKIKALVVDGFSNHDWRHTTECVLALLLETGLCDVTVSTAPLNGSPHYDDWSPRFSDYDVVIQICNDGKSGHKWPEKVRNEFEDYVRSGGGLYILHGANNAFIDWAAYNEMIGLGWRGVDEWQSLEIQDFKRVPIPRGEGMRTHHGKRTDMVVQMLDDHPITKGYPQNWKTTDVELYQFPRGPSKNLTVISFGKHEETGKQWPMEWTVAFGQGHVYNGTFGHVWRTERHPPGVQCVGWQTTFIRTIQWLADHEVTYPLPSDFPTAESVSLRPLSFQHRASEGWTSIFNGQNLDGWSVSSSAHQDFWSVADGAIEANSIESNGHPHNWLLSDQEYGDFQLKLKFQVFSANTGNSGVLFRSRSYESEGATKMDGLQADIDPRGMVKTGLIYDGTVGMQRWIFPSMPNHRLPQDDLPRSARGTTLRFADEDPNAWNDFEIVCEGNFVRSYVNGKLVSNLNGNDLINDLLHQERGVDQKGVIGLELHANHQMKIRFADIWIRSLE